MGGTPTAQDAGDAPWLWPRSRSPGRADHFTLVQVGPEGSGTECLVTSPSSMVVRRLVIKAIGGGDAPVQGAGTEAARPDVGDSTHREVPHDRTAGGPAGSQEGARCFQKGLGNQ